MEKKEEITRQPVDKSAVKALRFVLGAGAMLIDWNIDYAKGEGVLGDYEKCLWTKSGKRITVSVSRDGALFTDMSKEVDPIYKDLTNL